jgi:hypothetical protein
VIRPQTQFGAIRQHAVLNDSGETIPAWAVMEPSDFNGLYHTVRKPTVDDSAWVLLNGPMPISAGGYGSGTWDLPNLAKYETGDGTPAVGESWGSRAGYWGLSRGYEGFIVLGNGDGTKTMVERDSLCASTEAGNPYYGYFYASAPPHLRVHCPCCDEAPYQWEFDLSTGATFGLCWDFSAKDCSAMAGHWVLTHSVDISSPAICVWDSGDTGTGVCPSAGGYSHFALLLYCATWLWQLQYYDRGGDSTIWQDTLDPAEGCIRTAELPLFADGIFCTPTPDPVVITPR